MNIYSPDGITNRGLQLCGIVIGFFGEVPKRLPVHCNSRFFQHDIPVCTLTVSQARLIQTLSLDCYAKSLFCASWLDL